MGEMTWCLGKREESKTGKKKKARKEKREREEGKKEGRERGREGGTEEGRKRKPDTLARNKTKQTEKKKQY